MILWVFCAPAYVDPSIGYRYYSLQHIPVVDAIQLCVDLDIPLKTKLRIIAWTAAAGFTMAN